MTNPETVGVDLGGTKILVGVVGENRKVLYEDQERSAGQSQDEHLDALGRYRFGWSDSDAAGSAAKRGLNPAVVENISSLLTHLDQVRLAGKSAEVAQEHEHQRPGAPP